MDKQEFAEKVDQLISTMQPLPWRRHAVDKLIQEYIQETGTRPDSYQLHRLANHLLADELKDKSPDKVSREEFPILSHWQIKTRNKRERNIGDERLDTLKLKQRKRIKTLSNRRFEG
jgi:hypothetical protein